mmetsp:Transcript_45516/g.146628  ORF Transcript_45516/g.146628 Transcript_45516/m.146628 type:complete len:402 (+) Transcript_45516:273-1478(+)
MRAAVQRGRDRAVDARLTQRGGRRRDDVVEGGGARIAVAPLVDQHERPVALQRLVHLAAEHLRPLPRRKGGAVQVQQKGARRTRLGRVVRAAQLLATGLGDPSRHRSRAGVVPREVDVEAPLGRERRRRRAEEVAREEDGLVCAGRLPRAKQLDDQQLHRAHLEGAQPVPRHQRRREDMLAQLVGALGTVDVERHSAVRRVCLQQQNQRPLPLNRGAQLAQAVAGAHVVGGGCAVGDGGRARQQHDHGLRVADVLLQPRGVVQVVDIKEGRDVLHVPLQLPLERLCLVLPARPHVGEEDVVPPIRQPHSRDDPRLVCLCQLPRRRAPLGARHEREGDGAMQRPLPRPSRRLPACKVALRVPDNALEMPPPPPQPEVTESAAEAERNEPRRERRDECNHPPV